jgi:hypothetical protein
MSIAACQPETEFRDMQRRYLILLLGAICGAGLTGCRCFYCFEPYNDFIDDHMDYPIWFDRWYNPRLDISRAGKPDWCGPINRFLAPCRCADQECYDRHDEVWQYPPRYLHQHPSNFYPGPSNVITAPPPIEYSGPRIEVPNQTPESSPEMAPEPPAPGLTPESPEE